MPFNGEEIRRVNPIFIEKLENISVLWKQGHCRNRFATQHPIQVLCQGKTGSLHHSGGHLTTRFRLLNKFLRQSLHGAQDFGWRNLPHHLQCPHGLV